MDLQVLVHSDASVSQVVGFFPSDVERMNQYCVMQNPERLPHSRSQGRNEKRVKFGQVDFIIKVFESTTNLFFQYQFNQGIPHVVFETQSELEVIDTHEVGLTKGHRRYNVKGCER